MMTKKEQRIYLEGYKQGTVDARCHIMEVLMKVNPIEKKEKKK